MIVLVPEPRDFLSILGSAADAAAVNLNGVKDWFKGELHSNYIFLYFALIGLEWDFITLFTKMNFFSTKTLISTPFAQDIYGSLFTTMNICEWSQWEQKNFNQLST